MTTLRPGVGAECTILTRFIKPEQLLPLGDKAHRSTVILDSQFQDDKGRKFFRFRFAAGDHRDELLIGSSRWVKITKEGDPSLYFGEPEVLHEMSINKVAFKEPKIKWKNSMAKKLLYKDLKDGIVPADAGQDMTVRDIFSMRPEYAEYDFSRFSSRLASLRKSLKNNISRADDDKHAFDVYVQNNDVSLYSSKGYIQWQGSKAQELLRSDILDGLVDEIGKLNLWQSREEYYNQFPLKEFRDKIDQEIGTKKYLHTLKVKGKLHKSS